MYRRRSRISCLSPASSPSQLAAAAGRGRGKRVRGGEMELYETERSDGGSGGGGGAVRAPEGRGRSRRPHGTEMEESVSSGVWTEVDGRNRAASIIQRLRSSLGNAELEAPLTQG